jgi:hypothetical protein
LVTLVSYDNPKGDLNFFSYYFRHTDNDYIYARTYSFTAQFTIPKPFDIMETAKGNFFGSSIKTWFKELPAEITAQHLIGVLSFALAPTLRGDDNKFPPGMKRAFNTISKQENAKTGTAEKSSYIFYINGLRLER